MSSVFDLLPIPFKPAIPFLQTGVNFGFTPERMYKMLLLADLAIPISAITDIMDGFKAEIVAGNYMKSLAPNVIPNPDYIPESLGSQRKSFAHTLELTTTDIRTGETTIRYITISTNRNLTTQGIVNEAWAILQDEQYGINLTEVRISIKSSRRASSLI